MNTKEYIASGILENYLLENCSEQEQKEVECLSKIYPEIKQELDLIEASLEQYAMANKKDVPEGLWDAIEAEIEDEQVEVEEKTPIVKTLPQAEKKESSINVWRVAASVALLATTAMSIFFYQKTDTLQIEANTKQEQVVDLQQKLDLISADVNAQNALLANLALPETKRLVLDGIETKAPGSKAYVVYNPQIESVYLNAGSLPVNPTGMQYQLWGLKDGKPFSLGVFDKLDDGAFIAMEGISGVQAFAITLEEAGGKPEPNLEELYVIGEVG